jgi:cob(I)alamin adenosyltransferase
MMNGQIHIYSGDGKGKTTAAIGLAVRAYGADKKVPFELVKRADLVTEMLNIRHYYADKNLKAREGIEF